MFKVRVEFLSEPRRAPMECEIARVPVVGDMISTGDEAWTVKYAILVINPNAGEYVAYLRVAQ